ncbi:MAG TPA: hypothetical protein VF282_00865 [Bacillota bacterium]
MLGAEGRVLLPYLRAYRHLIANHVQVAAGWLELGDSGRARAALEVLSRRLEAEARLASELPEPLAGLVLGLAVLAEEQGIQVGFEFAGHHAAPALPAPEDAAENVDDACRAVAAGLARLERALAATVEDRRLLVTWGGGRLLLEAPGSGLPPVAVRLAGAGPGGRAQDPPAGPEGPPP